MLILAGPRVDGQVNEGLLEAKRTRSAFVTESEKELVKVDGVGQTSSIKYRFIRRIRVYIRRQHPYSGELQ